MKLWILLTLLFCCIDIKGSNSQEKYYDLQEVEVVNESFAKAIDSVLYQLKKSTFVYKDKADIFIIPYPIVNDLAFQFASFGPGSSALPFSQYYFRYDGYTFFISPENKSMKRVFRETGRNERFTMPIEKPRPNDNVIPIVDVNDDSDPTWKILFRNSRCVLLTDWVPNEKGVGGEMQWRNDENVQYYYKRQEVCFSRDKVNIPISANELTDSVIYNVYHDYEAEDHIYEVFIVEKSPLRFKIEYRDLENQPQPVQTGWVDKKYCGVWDRCYYDEFRKGYIKLYKDPNKDSDFIKIYKQPYDALVVTDFQGEFLQVLFEIDNTIYVGWVDKYCRNVFNSCN